MRTLHKWFGAILCLFLATIAATGFLLATKGTFGWIRPAEQTGMPLGDDPKIAEVVDVADAAFAHGIPELQSFKDIDRIDYRPKSNIFKVVSKKGYHEVQVDGTTGKVLGVARRNDQLAEDVHDLSFFGDAIHDYGLPVVAIGLLTLAITGSVIFATPYVRRWQYKRRKSVENVDAAP